MSLLSTGLNDFKAIYKGNRELKKLAEKGSFITCHTKPVTVKDYAIKNYAKKA